jgi:hypothetical protein
VKQLALAASSSFASKKEKKRKSARAAAFFIFVKILYTHRAPTRSQEAPRLLLAPWQSAALALASV